jgi:general secretion pathway protein G
MKIHIQKPNSDQWQVTSDKQRSRAPLKTHHSLLITHHSAFTLTEIMLVVVIIGILAALVIPKIAGQGERARVTAANADINGGIKSALGQYEVDNGFYPKSLNDLLAAPGNAKNWHGPYFDPPKVPMDPWGNAYIYYYPGKHNASSYDLLSVGPDAKEGTDDDIGNWTK